MPEPYTVKCLDAKYDEDSGMLVLNCWFNTFNGPRVVVLNKNDFHYKNLGQAVPDEEMHRTASLFAKYKYEFKLIIEDDPDREKLNDDNYGQYVNDFTKQISSELDSAVVGLEDSQEQLGRRLGNLMGQGKIDVNEMLKKEMAIRAKLGGAI